MGTVLLSRVGRSVALATAATLFLTAAVPPMAQARPASQPTPVAAENGAVASTATDISARKRHYTHRRHYHRGNAAAGAAFMGLALGAMGAIAADQRRRDYYRHNYYYGGNPYYGRHYYGGPAYYGGPYYYGY